MISAFGPFITDMYLPSLPTMVDDFNATTTDIQWGITASLIGLAAGQLLFGPISDRWGRKPILILSLVLYSIATIGNIYSLNVDAFNCFRFFQGIGGAGGIVLSRSIATDCYSGKKLSQIMALIGAVNGIAPIVAPIIGSFIADVFGWRGVFWVLLSLGFLLLIMSFPFYESLGKDMRLTGPFKNIFSVFFNLLKDKNFIRCVLVYALSNCILFAYIASAPFIIQEIFFYGKMGFAMVFAVNACAIVGGSALSLKFRYPRNAIMTGIGIVIICGVFLVVGSVLFRSFYIYEICIWVMLLGIGFIFPSVTAIAMEHGRKALGAASALLGAAGFTCGGLISPICGLGEMLFTVSIVITCSGFLLLIFSKKVC